jgi:hypothetical protein
MRTASSFTPDQASASDARLRGNLARLQRMESVVAALVAEGAFEHVALYAEVAAHLAAHAHAGRFSSTVLEAALAEAGRHLAVAEPSPTTAGHERTGDHILHVATELAFPEGGHSRSLLRWILADSGRRHSLALTSPRGEAPTELRAAIESSGGAVHRLAPGSSSFLRRAAELRGLAVACDYVVLHLHPWDTVATMALAFPGRPPTVINNHAGHLFGLGRTVSDVVTCGRDVAREICVTRRGIPSEACQSMPVLAWATPEQEILRDRARRALQADPADLVLLTVASEYKLQRLDGHDLVGTVSAAIEKRPGIVWRIVGPPAAGAWQEVAERTAGRVRALGAELDASCLYAGADGVVDSYPFTSQTALLDALVVALPVFAPRWHPPEARILAAWGSAPDAAIKGFDDDASLGILLDRWLSSRAKDGPAPGTPGGGPALSAWREALEKVYRAAARRRDERAADGTAKTAHGEGATNDLDRYLVGLYSLPPEDRVVINWHRELTNLGAATAFPGEEEWLAGRPGLAGLVGELELVVRDYEAYARLLREPSRLPHEQAEAVLE